MNGTSGVSGLTGGNCTREEAEQYRREFAGVSGWDGTIAQSQDSASTPRVSAGFDFANADDRARWVAACQTHVGDDREAVSDAELGWCADVQAWYAESQDSAPGGRS